MKTYYTPEALEAMKANMAMSKETWHKVMNPLCAECLMERGRSLAQNGFPKYPPLAEDEVT